MDSTLRQEILGWLATQVPEVRLQHTLRVEAMAIALAAQHGLDQGQAAMAGLMHDLAKCFKPQRLLEMAIAAGLELDPVDRANPHLLHAEVGALVAQQQFGISDAQVLQAIANHTLGRPQMSPLSCAVFLADSLEPGRGDTAALNHLRQISQQNLITATWMTCDYTVRHLLDSRRLIHPRALETRNWFLRADSSRAEA